MVRAYLHMSKDKNNIVAQPKNAPGLQQLTRFLQTLSVTGNVSESCRQSGLSRYVVYDLKERNPEFALAYEDALNVATDELLAQARYRALNGSDRLLELMLKAYNPGLFSEKTNIEVSHTLKKPVSDMTDAELLNVIEAQTVDSIGDMDIPTGSLNQDLTHKLPGPSATDRVSEPEPMKQESCQNAEKESCQNHEPWSIDLDC